MKKMLIAAMLLICCVAQAQEPIRGTIFKDWKKEPKLNYLKNDQPLDQAGNWLIAMGVSSVAATGFLYLGSQTTNKGDRQLFNFLGAFCAGVTVASPIVAGSKLKKHSREKY